MAEEKDSLDHMAGKGLSFEIEGKTYKLSVPTLGMLGEFESWIRSRKISELEAGAKKMDKAEKLTLIKDILASEISDGERAAAMSSMSGVCHFLYLSLKPNHPEITEDEVAQMVDLDNLAEISTVLQNMGGEPGPPPTQEAAEKLVGEGSTAS